MFTDSAENTWGEEKKDKIAFVCQINYEKIPA